MIFKIIIIAVAVFLISLGIADNEVVYADDSELDLGYRVIAQYNPVECEKWTYFEGYRQNRHNDKSVEDKELEEKRQEEAKKQAEDEYDGGINVDEKNDPPLGETGSDKDQPQKIPGKRDVIEEDKELKPDKKKKQKKIRKLKTLPDNTRNEYSPTLENMGLISRLNIMSREDCNKG